MAWPSWPSPLRRCDRFKSCVGLDVGQTERNISFCGHTILAREPLIIANAETDPRFADNPLVTGEPHIRFYAGIPLSDPDGHRLGTFCVIDRRSRHLSFPILHRR